MQLSRDNNSSKVQSLTSKKEIKSRNKFTPSTPNQKMPKEEFQKSLRNWKIFKLTLMSSRNTKMLRTKFWINWIKTLKELVIRKSNTGMKRISSRSRKTSSMINTTNLLLDTANTSISFKISNGWLKWKTSFRNPLITRRSKRKITKRGWPKEKPEKKRKRENKKNMNRRKPKELKEMLRQKKMQLRMQDKMKSMHWRRLMTLSITLMSVLILWLRRLSNAMLFWDFATRNWVIQLKRSKKLKNKKKRERRIVS